jgi:glycerol-3-phosphate cytidylyltransferase
MKIGFTCSTFDLFHAGHIMMLKEAKSHCDYLIVGLQTDPTIDRPDTKNKPIQSMFERWLQVAACSFVDEVIPFATEQEICDIILTLRPDIRIVGEEYRDINFTGKGLCNVYYNERKHSFSSTSMRERIKNG